MRVKIRQLEDGSWLVHADGRDDVTGYDAKVIVADADDAGDKVPALLAPWDKRRKAIKDAIKGG